MRRPARSRMLIAAGKASLTAALLWWLLRSIDLAAMGTIVSRLHMSSLGVATLLLLLQLLLIGWRWHRIVDRLGATLPPIKAVSWVLVGSFFNQALPTAVGGDVVRIWKLQRSGAPPGLAFTSVAVERASGIALLGLMITVCAAMTWDALSSDLRLASALCGPALVFLLASLAYGDRLTGRWLPERLTRLVRDVAAGLRRLAGTWSGLGELSLLGIAGSLAGLGAAFVLGRDLGVDVPFAAIVVAVGGAVMLSVLPISFGGWGVREAGVIGLLGTFGVDAEHALSLSLIWGLLQAVISVVGGFAWWLERDDPKRDPASSADPAVAAIPMRK